MTGQIEGTPAGYPGAEFERFIAETLRRLEQIEQTLGGPIRGWTWARDPADLPALTQPDGTLVEFMPQASPIIAGMLTRIASLEGQVTGPMPGWTWAGVEGGPAVRDPQGNLWRLMRMRNSTPGPIRVYGDSNSQNPSVSGQAPWPERAFPNAVIDLAVNGRGWYYSSPTIGNDIGSTTGAHGTVLLAGGINDINNGYSAAQVEAAIAAWTDWLIRKGARVGLMTIFPVGAAYAGSNPVRAAVNDWIRGTYNSGKDAFYVDAASVLETSPNGPLAAGYDLGDNLHINPAGHQRVADFVQVTMGTG